MTTIPESEYGFLFHYYRAEVYRESNWRSRLDVTTNWAIVTTAAIISFAFGEPRVPHTIILVNYLLIWFFLYLEARRYRYYTMLRERTRALEKELFAPIFSGTNIKNLDVEKWQHAVSDDLQKPHVHMSKAEAIAWRMKHNYIMLFIFLFLVWITKIRAYPVDAIDLEQMFENARLSFIPGGLVFAVFSIFLTITIAFAIYIPRHSEVDDLP